MPTLFARRYMRGRPGRLEQVIGAGLLLLVAAVVAVFLATGGMLGPSAAGSNVIRRLAAGLGMPLEPLFAVDPEHMRTLAAPHALRLAAALLPQFPSAGDRLWLTAWPVRDGQTAVLAAEALSQAGISASFTPDGATCGLLEDFGAQWACAAAYAGAEGEEATVVMAIDAGEPQNAFGLAWALRPQGAADVRLGRGGWRSQDGRRCGFWSGRYVTLTAGPRAEPTARLVSGIQLVYGGPFPAEALLPAEERLPGSLRYVRRSALGVEELRDCWLAEYGDGRLLVLMTPPDPAAKADELRGRAGESGQIGGRAAVVREAANAVFLALAGDDEAARALAERAAARAGPTVTSPTAEVATAPPAAGQARFPEIEGGDIAAPVRIERYAENLYEKIDGKEGMFRAFEVVDLRFGQYFDRRGNRSFDVYIYDMGEPANALGIYMTERSGAVDRLEVGRSGYVSGSGAFFWKGRYYVNVLGPGDGGEDALAISRTIAAAVAGTIADDGRPFWAEDALPAEDRVPDSLTYQAGSALGYEFLNRVFLADYLAGRRRFQAFVTRCGGPQEAADVFERFAAAVARYDTLLERRADEGGGERLVGESLGVFTVVFRKGPYVGGIVECEDRALAEQRAAALAARLSAGDAGDGRAGPAPQAPAPRKDRAPAASQESGEGEYG